MRKVKSKAAAPRGALPILPRPLAVALAILAEPLRRLSAEDRSDLLEAAGYFFGATDEEERESAALTILEICDPTPSGILPLDVEPTEELRAWTRWTAKRIRHLRKRAKLTQAELAARSGLTQSHISHLESAEYAPNGHTRERLAKALGVTSDDFDPPDGTI